MKLKIFPKLVFILTLIAVIPATIIGLRAVAVTKQGMQSSIIELHTHLAFSLAETIDSSLADKERELQFIARALPPSMPWSDRRALLQSLIDANENFISIAVVDRGGREIIKTYNPAQAKNPKETALRTQSRCRDFLKHPAPISRSGIYGTGEHPRMDMIVPLSAEHCVYAVISLEPLWNRISATRFGNTGCAFLFDEHGVMLTKPARVVSGSSPTDQPIVVKQTIGGFPLIFCEYRRADNGTIILRAHAPMKRLNGTLVVQQDKHEAFDSVRRTQEHLGWMVVFSVGFACLIALVIARGLTKPITALAAAAGRIAAKDFTARVAITTHDELSGLSEIFNTMTMELERYDKLQIDTIIKEKTKTEAIVFSITDGIVMMDSAGRIQFTNTLAKELLALPAAHELNALLSDTIGEPALQKAFADIVGNPSKNNRREVMTAVRGLRRYYILTTGMIAGDAGKGTGGLVTTVRDITVEKELDNIKEEFLHSITHDLRNPMTSIMGFLQFMIDDVAGPTTPLQKKMLLTMNRASHRLLGLVNNILDIAKMESNTLVLSLYETDLRAVVQRSIEILEAVALRKSITLSLECPVDLPPISIDGELIDRVFSNLINNALKFTPEQGRVTIGIRPLPGQIVCTVSDSGEGIPPEYLDKIFEKFQQVPGHRKGGTGLGLTICKHIIEAHKGTISVESTLGKGSTFTFTIPTGLTTEILAPPVVQQ
ncbi:MAG: ATP-binding protein [Elusimicrobia bacterium]|nr:ATP-binding protein [Elusimicrobiota bacterium]